MSQLECRAVGTVAETDLEELTQLLIGISGGQPEPVYQHDVVLRAPAAAPAADGAPAGWKPDLRLQHDLAPCNSGIPDAAERWTVLQFSLHLRGKQHATLPATVRHVTRTYCTGDDVPAFWRALGFTPRYQLIRRGHRFTVPAAGQEVDVSVCRVLRVPAAAAVGPGGGSAGTSNGGNGSIPSAAALQQAEEVSPGRLVVEAVAIVPSEADHMDTVGALTSVAALLQPFTTLQRPPRAPGEPL